MPAEHIVFPITREVTDLVADRFSSNLNIALRTESETLQNEYPELNDILLFTGLSDKQHGRDIVRGGLFTFSALRMQAASYGSRLPQLPRNYMEIHSQDLISMMQPGERLDKFNNRVIDQIAKIDNEPHLARLIRTASIFSEDPVFIFDGAINIYLPIKRYLDAQKFSGSWPSS